MWVGRAQEVDELIISADIEVPADRSAGSAGLGRIAGEPEQWLFETRRAA
jgi:hypothetical protein